MKGLNWTDYESKIECKINEQAEEINDIQELMTIISEVADNIMRKTTGKPRRTLVPWWNDDLKNAIKDRRIAQKKYYRSKTEDNLIELRRTRAKARILQKVDKRYPLGRDLGKSLSDR